MRNCYRSGIISMMMCVSSFQLSAQLSTDSQLSADSLLTAVTLKQAVDYAIKYQPAVQQSLADEEITSANVRSRLAGWYPQVNFNYNLQHNFILPTTIVQGTPQRFGVDNVSAAQFTVTQPIFNRDVLLAARTRRDVLQQARQATSSSKIETETAVSKAFYAVLAAAQQIRVSAENITRLERSLQDAYRQYQAGVTDKTDYKRAQIGLNNARALERTNKEMLKARVEYLKSVMGYPASGALEIVYDSLQMEKEVYLDTLATVNYSSRIEYRILETQQRLLEANLRYNRWSYLPSLAANGAYNFNYQHNELPKLYNTNYPNSFAALTLTLPIFQGGRRKADIQAAEWQLERNRLEIVGLRNAINAEYAAALAAYKAFLADFTAVQENLALALEVYDVIQLQYRAGIKTYLEVINAETDLRTAQINYYNALYNLMAGKIDVQKALGQIIY